MPVQSDNTTGVLEYSANNSGGSWWLSDENWKNLAARGWTVEWAADQKDPIFRSDDGRFLGALATEASKRFVSAQDGMDDWREITGLSPSEIGCNCCGPPHNFYWKGDDGTTRYGSAYVSETDFEWS